MIEHIVNDVKDMTLIEIEPDGLCYVMCVLNFAKNSVFQVLRATGDGGIVKIGMMFFLALSKGSFVESLFKHYKHHLSTSVPLLYTPFGRADVIKIANRIYQSADREPYKEREKLLKLELGNMWNQPMAELFFPCMSIMLNIDIVIWGLKTDNGYPRFEVLYSFKPKESALCSCNLIWCTTMYNRAHFQLLLFPHPKTGNVDHTIIDIS